LKNEKNDDDVSSNCDVEFDQIDALFADNISWDTNSQEFVDPDPEYEEADFINNFEIWDN
jgi:sensor domain CHASE-containing protein